MHSIISTELGNCDEKGFTVWVWEESWLICLIVLFLQGHSSMRRPGPLCCTLSPNATASARFPVLCLTETLQKKTDRRSQHGGNSESASIQLCTTHFRPVMSAWCHVVSLLFGTWTQYNIPKVLCNIFSELFAIWSPVMVYRFCSLLSQLFQAIASIFRLLHFWLMEKKGLDLK